MYKRIFYTYLFVLLFVYLRCTSVKTEAKPNILFISIDDLKPTIGAYGDQCVFTPNINRLAERGTVFLNTHCQQSVCGPTRATMLTGMYPDQVRVWGFENQIRDAGFDLVTLPQHFKNEGYYTVGI